MRRVVGPVGQLLHEQGEVVAGEPPFEGGRGLLVASLEGGDAGLDSRRGRGSRPTTRSVRKAYILQYAPAHGAALVGDPAAPLIGRAPRGDRMRQCEVLRGGDARQPLPLAPPSVTA